MNNYSLTIGQSVIYNNKRCIIKDLGWTIVIIKLPNGDIKKLFKDELKWDTIQIII